MVIVGVAASVWRLIRCVRTACGTAHGWPACGSGMVRRGVLFRPCPSAAKIPIRRMSRRGPACATASVGLRSILPEAMRPPAARSSTPASKAAASGAPWTVVRPGPWFPVHQATGMVFTPSADRWWPASW